MKIENYWLPLFIRPSLCISAPIKMPSLNYQINDPYNWPSDDDGSDR